MLVFLHLNNFINQMSCKHWQTFSYIGSRARVLLMLVYTCASQMIKRAARLAQDFPEVGRQLPGGGAIHDFAKFPHKLHEIERIWAPRGCVPRVALRSTNVVIKRPAGITPELNLWNSLQVRRHASDGSTLAFRPRRGVTIQKYTRITL